VEIIKTHYPTVRFVAIKDPCGVVWLTLYASEAGGPSLRLKNGYAQDDIEQGMGCA
jgi:hypothetical protein